MVNNQENDCSCAAAHWRSCMPDEAGVLAVLLLEGGLLCVGRWSGEAWSVAVPAATGNRVVCWAPITVPIVMEVDDGKQS